MVFVSGPEDVPTEIRAVEAPDDHDGIPQPELLRDVAAHLGRRRGGEREDLAPE